MAKAKSWFQLDSSFRRYESQNMRYRIFSLLLLVPSLAWGQGKQRGFFSLHGDSATVFQLDADAKYVLLGFESGGICVFPTDQPSVLVRGYNGHKKAVTGAAFIPMSTELITSSADGSVKVWKLEDARKHQKAIEDSNGKAKPANPTPVRTIQAHSNCNGMSLRPDGKRLATAGSDGSIKLFDPSTGKQLETLGVVHAGGARSIAFSADGKLLATGGQEKTTKIWDVSGEKPVLKQTIEGGDGPVTAVNFSPDGSQLAIGFGLPKKPNAIHLVEVATGKVVGKLPGHTDVVHYVLFHPKTAHLASGGADSMIRTWDLDEKKQVNADEHGEPVMWLTISPDGQRFGSCSARTARWWLGFGK